MCGKITMSRMGIMGNLRSSFRSRLSLDGWLTGFLSRLRFPVIVTGHALKKG